MKKDKGFRYENGTFRISKDFKWTKTFTPPTEELKMNEDKLNKLKEVKDNLFSFLEEIEMKKNYWHEAVAFEVLFERMEKRLNEEKN